MCSELLRGPTASDNCSKQNLNKGSIRDSTKQAADNIESQNLEQGLRE